MKIDIENLLNLALVRVEKVEMSDNKLEVNCQSASPVGVCPKCLESSKNILKYYERNIQDLPVFGKRVYLKLRCRQFHCSNCDDYFSERFDFVGKNQQQTNRLQEYLYKMCQDIPLQQVCIKEDFCRASIERIYKKYAHRQLQQSHLFSKVRYLGIDEISIKKGKKDYACVLVDLERAVVLDFLESRCKEFLIKYFNKKGAEFCQQIEVLSSDMWDGFVNLVPEVFPNAVNVLDRFHLFTHLNKALDRERRTLRKEHKEEKCFKHLRWPLLRSKEKLSEQELETLQKAFEQAPHLKQICQLRRELKSIFDTHFSELQADVAIALWEQKAMQLNNKHLNRFLKMLKNWRSKILNFFSFRWTNACVEGINNHIRSIIRRSFGFRNFLNLKTRVLLEC